MGIHHQSFISPGAQQPQPPSHRQQHRYHRVTRVATAATAAQGGTAEGHTPSGHCPLPLAAPLVASCPLSPSQPQHHSPVSHSTTPSHCILHFVFSLVLFPHPPLTSSTPRSVYILHVSPHHIHCHCHIYHTRPLSANQECDFVMASSGDGRLGSAVPGARGTLWTHTILIPPPVCDHCVPLAAR